jgi:hypothetical protein
LQILNGPSQLLDLAGMRVALLADHVGNGLCELRTLGLALAARSFNLFLEVARDKGHGRTFHKVHTLG